MEGATALHLTDTDTVLATDAALCCVKIAEKPKSSEIYDCHKIAWICGKCAPQRKLPQAERERDRDKECERRRAA